MFVRTKDWRRLINIGHITQLHRTHEGAVAILQNDERILLQEEFDTLEIGFEFAAVVPAQPGFEVVAFLCETDAPASEGYVLQEPVLGWRIGSRQVAAVVLDPQLSTDMIKRPDGSIICWGDKSWPTFEVWLADQKTTHDKRRLSQKVAE